MTRSARAVLAGLLALAAVGLVVLVFRPEPDRTALSLDGSSPVPAAPADTEPDAAPAPLEGAEGAVGLVARPNAGGAVNPVTPTGGAGGPAGQTPAYGQPGGAPSRVVRP